MKTRRDFREDFLKDKDKTQIYNQISYQICLRTVHELFSADEIEALQLIIFNGVVEFIDRSTGRQTRSCTLSLEVSRERFAELDLRRIDPKLCFDNLRGRGHPNLRGYEPVMPFMEFNTQDQRFVDGKDIINRLRSGANLSELSWGDFEHLIRDLFEKEFAETAAAVKVTRASRDGGVDVVVFDKDAIRGGKTVIQAKHYAKPVGVAAVRELYGVVIKEGAIKGILVTTSRFTAAAHEEIKNLPINLFDQPGLIALLEKHGHRLRVDISVGKCREEELILDEEDDKATSRYLAAYDLESDVDRKVKLSELNFEDFRLLIRDVFEREFSESGSIVRLTRVTQRRGVDLVVSDPDPIRGGKIVIEAKRYTSPVGASAVRALYGVIISEGAQKGLLVTTSKFTSSALEEAKGLPISLIDSDGLIALLEKHNYKGMDYTSR